MAEIETHKIFQLRNYNLVRNLITLLFHTSNIKSCCYSSFFVSVEREKKRIRENERGKVPVSSKIVLSSSVNTVRAMWKCRLISKAIIITPYFITK